MKNEGISNKEELKGNALKEARELTNIDISVIANEINFRLVAKQARLDQFYQIGQSHFIFRFKTKEGKIDLVFNPPKFLFLRESEKTETETNPFTTVLKNNFLNRILKSARQIQNDRILSLEFEGGSVILECIRKGNTVILKEGKIVGLSEEEKMKDRELQQNGTYAPPSTAKKEISNQNVIEAIKGKEKIVVAITRAVAIPALYANELLYEIGIDPKKESESLKPEEIKAIAERIEEFQRNLSEGKTRTLRYGEKYLVADKKLAESLNKKNGDTTGVESLSQILSSLYRKQMSTQIKTTTEKKMNQLLSRLEHQEIRAKQVEAEIEEEKRKGEWIISNIEKVNSLVQEYKSIKASNDKAMLEEFLNKNKAALTKNGIKLEI